MITIERIDGKRTYSFLNMLSSPPAPQEAYVLPGKHHLVVKFQTGNGYAFGNLWLVVEKGMTYTIKAEFSGYSVHFWTEDKHGNIVGGITGSVDEPKNTLPTQKTDKS